MATFIEATVWVLVDAVGDWEVGTDEEELNERWDERIGTTSGNRRMIQMTVKIPLPKPLKISVTVPEEANGGGELQVEVA